MVVQTVSGHCVRFASSIVHERVLTLPTFYAMCRRHDGREDLKLWLCHDHLDGECHECGFKYDLVATTLSSCSSVLP